MKSRQRLTMAAVLAVLLAAVAGWHLSRGRIAPADPVERLRPDYEARLQLSPEHLQALRPVVSTAADDMTRIRRELRSQLTSTVRDLNATIAKELSPDRRFSPADTTGGPEQKAAP